MKSIYVEIGPQKLPALVRYFVAGADRSVGIMSDYVDDWEIEYFCNVRMTRPAKWLYDAIEAIPGENDRIAELCDADFKSGGLREDWED